jgi:hypothetical protein
MSISAASSPQPPSLPSSLSAAAVPSTLPRIPSPIVLAGAQVSAIRRVGPDDEKDSALFALPARPSKMPECQGFTLSAQDKDKFESTQLMHRGGKQSEPVIGALQCFAFVFCRTCTR